jgi:hypothetical protein
MGFFDGLLAAYTQIEPMHCYCFHQFTTSLPILRSLTLKLRELYKILKQLHCRMLTQSSSNIQKGFVEHENHAFYQYNNEMTFSCLFFALIAIQVND